MPVLYINDRKLLFTDDPDIRKPVVAFDGMPGALFRIISSFESDNTELLQVKCDVADIYNQLSGIYKVIPAAGGIVINELNELLMIRRFGKWDLPKGKCEDGELPEQAAVREVEEECGIKVSAITGGIGTTWHTYSLKGNRIMKVTHWFRMSAKNQHPTPQQEEGISGVRWMPFRDVERAMHESYTSIKDLLTANLRGLNTGHAD